MIDRRNLLGLLAALAAAPGLAPAQDGAHSLAHLWAAWKGRYLDASGRVIDRVQDNASHSEGQGYGLLLAAAFEDRVAFARIFAWTEENLAIRDDALLAWRWQPDSVPPVGDRNNASDGDLFYGWALMRGARAFDAPIYERRAADVASALARKIIVPAPGNEEALLFLPAAFGFDTEAGYVLNPSYYMLRAMQELGAAYDQPRLTAAAADGEALLARLAADGPVPDWVEITAEGPRAAGDFSRDSGYEALRVPLFLIWSGRVDHPAVKAAYIPGTSRDVPGKLTATVVESETGAVMETSAAPGYRAITALVTCAIDRSQGSAMPPMSVEQPYYPATLQMFAILAQSEVLPECFPI